MPQTSSHEVMVSARPSTNLDFRLESKTVPSHSACNPLEKGKVDFSVTVCQLNEGFQQVLRVEGRERGIKTHHLAYVVSGKGK